MPQKVQIRVTSNQVSLEIHSIQWKFELTGFELTAISNIEKIGKMQRFW